MITWLAPNVMNRNRYVVRQLMVHVWMQSEYCLVPGLRNFYFARKDETQVFVQYILQSNDTYVSPTYIYKEKLFFLKHSFWYVAANCRLLRVPSRPTMTTVPGYVYYVLHYNSY